MKVYRKQTSIDSEISGAKIDAVRSQKKKLPGAYFVKSCL